MTTPTSARTRPTLRILLGAAIAMGPGKADLLEAIARTGSITGAAKEMGMSYRRAWLLVDTMNRCFRKPLVDAATGGSRGGGASLTPLGEEALARYREMEAHAVAAINSEVRAFRGLLRARAKPPRKA